MNNFIRNNWISISFTILGAITGYLYWYYIGCTSGTCPLKTIWYNNVIIGGIMGYLVGSSITDALKKKLKAKKEK